MSALIAAPLVIFGFLATALAGLLRASINLYNDASSLPKSKRLRSPGFGEACGMAIIATIINYALRLVLGIESSPANVELEVQQRILSAVEAFATSVASLTATLSIMLPAHVSRSIIVSLIAMVLAFAVVAMLFVALYLIVLAVNYAFSPT